MQGKKQGTEKSSAAGTMRRVKLRSNSNVLRIPGPARRPARPGKRAGKSREFMARVVQLIADVS
jgi:hypothetical protein